MRKHWLDNLRWVVVLSVLFYHVIYFYNNKGVFGGIGGFGGNQYQDIVIYVLYPWFMMLMFLIAGISARYSLEKLSSKQFIKSRTRKLLVPATLGLFILHWITGFFNTQGASLTMGNPMLPEEMPVFIKYFIWSVSGIGPLWFIQDLWLFSIVIVLIRKIDKKDILWKTCEKIQIIPIILLGVLLYVGSFTLILYPRAESFDGLLNLYKPLNYLIPFLMGYFVFSHDKVQEKLGKYFPILISIAIVCGTILTITTFGQDNTLPQYLQSPLNIIYAWFMMLGLLGIFQRFCNKTNAFATYMTKSSFGLYVVHYVVIASFGYMLKVHTSLPVFAIYAILTLAVFVLSPLIYEVLRRIPFVRWCIFGIKK
ncbi:MAG: acyltransferase [Bacteroidales bacterium]|nr:acyltransferase [Bacteroidales bacterium]